MKQPVFAALPAMFCLLISFSPVGFAHEGMDHSGHGAGNPVPAADSAEAWTEGQILKIDSEAGKVTIRHGEIRNLGMAAMTMVFKAADAAMLEGIAPGSKVRFTAIRDSGGLRLTQIVVIP